MPKYLVQTIQTFRMDYVIEAKEEGHALDEVVCRMGEFEEISQADLGENIVCSREISEEEYLKFFDKENDYLKSWTKEQKLARIHKINYPDDWEFS